MSVAISLRTLIDNKRIQSKFSGKGMATAAVTKWMAAVTVEKNHDGSIILEMVIAAEKGSAVKGMYGDLFAGIPFHSVADSMDMLCVRLILNTDKRRIEGRTMLRRSVKSNAVDIEGKGNCQKNYNQKYSHKEPPWSYCSNSMHHFWQKFTR